MGVLKDIGVGCGCLVALIIFGGPTIMKILNLDWIKIFGGPSRGERSYRRRMANAYAQVNEILSDAAAQMARVANPFKLGGWR